MAKFSVTFSSKADVEGLKEILVLLEEHNLSIHHNIIRRRVLKQIERVSR